MADQSISSNNSVQENGIHPAWYGAGGLVAIGAASDIVGAGKRANHRRGLRKAEKDYESRVNNLAQQMMHDDKIANYDADYMKNYRSNRRKVRDKYKGIPSKNPTTQQTWDNLPLYDDRNPTFKGKQFYSAQAGKQLESKGITHPEMDDYDTYLANQQGSSSQHVKKPKKGLFRTLMAVKRMW